MEFRTLYMRVKKEAVMLRNAKIKLFIWPFTDSSSCYSKCRNFNYMQKAQFSTRRSELYVREIEERDREERPPYLRSISFKSLAICSFTVLSHARPVPQLKVGLDLSELKMPGVRAAEVINSNLAPSRLLTEDGGHLPAALPEGSWACGRQHVGKHGDAWASNEGKEQQTGEGRERRGRERNNRVYRIPSLSRSLGPDTAPDLGTSLFNQKLQMLNACIAKKVAAEMRKDEASDKVKDSSFLLCMLCMLCWKLRTSVWSVRGLFDLRNHHPFSSCCGKRRWQASDLCLLPSPLPPSLSLAPFAFHLALFAITDQYLLFFSAR